MSYAAMFFSLCNHPEWQRDCGMGTPSDPLVLTLEKDRKANKGKLNAVPPAALDKDVQKQIKCTRQ